MVSTSLQGIDAERFALSRRWVAVRIKVFWGNQLPDLRRRVGELRPEFPARRTKSSLRNTRPGLHLPLRAELPDSQEMGGQAWRTQFTEGFPFLGDPAEPGVFPGNTATTLPISRDQFFERAKWRVQFRRQKRDEHAAPLQKEASPQAAKGSLEGPFRAQEVARFL